MHTRSIAAAAAVLLTVALSGCGSGQSAGGTSSPVEEKTLIVFAAASMQSTFTELQQTFEAENPGTTITFNFAGSQALATQLGIPLISNQPQYSMLWRVIEDKVVPASREEGMSQIVWSPVAQGVLTGKYLPGQAAPAGSRATDTKGGAGMISRFMNDDVLTRVQKLKPVADELDLTMAQLAVAWVLQNDNLAAAIIGASRPEQIAENVKASGVVIPAELMARIDEALGDVVERDPSHTRAPESRP